MQGVFSPRNAHSRLGSRHFRMSRSYLDHYPDAMRWNVSSRFRLGRWACVSMDEYELPSYWWMLVVLGLLFLLGLLWLFQTPHVWLPPLPRQTWPEGLCFRTCLPFAG